MLILDLEVLATLPSEPVPPTGLRPDSVISSFIKIFSLIHFVSLGQARLVRSIGLGSPWKDVDI